MAGGGFLDRTTKPINTTAAIKWVLVESDVHTEYGDELIRTSLILISGFGGHNMNGSGKEDIVQAQAETGLYCTSCKNVCQAAY